jgi:hypothetical protein
MDTPDVSPLNQDVSLWVRYQKFGFHNSTEGHFAFHKTDLLTRVIVEGRKSGAYHQILDTVHAATVTCPQKSEYCNTFLLRISPLEYNTYHTRITLLNGGELISKRLLSSSVSFHMRYTSRDYTIMSIILRCIFIIFSVVFTMMYLIALIRQQQVLMWQSEQKFIAILLPLTVLYNNPIFFFQFLIVDWVFSFINSMFIITFFTFLMLSVLVMTHSIITTVSERTLLWFYIPKFLMVGIVWIYAVVLISLVSFISQMGGFNVGGIGGFGPLILVMGVLLLAYLINVTYFLIRALSKFMSLPNKKKKKLIFSWAMTFIVLGLTIADILLFSTGVQVGAVQFNVFYIAYNAYTIAMSIFYWPTSEHEFKEGHEEKDEMESMLHADEHFESYD